MLSIQRASLRLVVCMQVEGETKTVGVRSHVERIANEGSRPRMAGNVARLGESHDTHIERSHTHRFLECVA